MSEETLGAEDVDAPIPFELADTEESTKFEPVTPFQKYMIDRLDALEEVQHGLRDGVNTIGEMMNQIAEVFDGLAEKVKSGGIGALLGGFMGGNKNG